jgi:hypothetical protein
MKRLLAISSLVIFLASCKEEPPYINFTPSASIQDTTYIETSVPQAELKNVLLEEFSGVRCINCPTAQLTAKSISETYPGRVNIVTIHPLNKFNSLTLPFDVAIGDEHTSKYDFRTDPGAKMLDFVGYGTTGSLPIGNIDRKLFSGESARNIEHQKWPAYVAQALNETTPVNIDINSKVSGDSIEVTVKLIYTTIASDSQLVTVSILESEMEDYQEGKDQNGTGVIFENYVHKHVLRAVLTGYFGDYLNASYIPGRVFLKKYRIKRDPEWVATNLDALVLIHNNTSKKDVIHSKEVKVK